MRRASLLVFLLPTLAFAQAPRLFSELTNARGFGMGGAFRGLGIGADSVDGNPASMAIFRLYQMDLTGAWDPGLNEGFVSLAVRDSKTSNVAAGLSYHYLVVHENGRRRTAHLTSAAFALPISQSLSIGFRGKYLYMPGTDSVNAGTLDIGLSLQPTPGLIFGLSADNVIDTHDPELGRYYSASLSYLTGKLAIALDVLGDPGAKGGIKPIYDVGAEYIFGSVLPVRVGYTGNTYTKSNYLSLGLGYLTPKASLDLSYRHQFNGKGRMILLTLEIPE